MLKLLHMSLRRTNQLRVMSYQTRCPNMVARLCQAQHEHVKARSRPISCIVEMSEFHQPALWHVMPVV
jgi:hypothetical protein